MPIRSIAEWLLRPLVFRRYLPREFGGAPIYVSPSASLAFAVKPLGAIDPTLLSLAKEFVGPGARIWDIGANVGLFTVAAACLSGQNGSVLSLEADIWLSHLLRRTAGAQSPACAPIRILSAAAASSVSIREFEIATRGRASNHLQGYGSSQSGGTRERHAVVSVSLDWLLQFFDRPSLIKIDVEGAELEVLQGASKILDEVRPIFICEVSSISQAEISDLFRRRDYVLSDGELLPGNRRLLERAAWNTLAVPGEIYARSKNAAPR